MYTLRKITKESQINHCIGEWYELITLNEHPERFKNEYKKVFEKLQGELKEKEPFVHAFINADQTYPVYTDEFVYIMNGKGETFSSVIYSGLKK